MTPKKADYMRGYGDGFKDGAIARPHPIPIHQADTPGVDEPPRHIEDNWTQEQHAAAEAALGGYLTIPVRIALFGQSACDCNTMSPDVHMHLPTCRYRIAMELADEVEALSDDRDTFIAAHALERKKKLIAIAALEEIRDLHGMEPVTVYDIARAAIAKAS